MDGLTSHGFAVARGDDVEGTASQDVSGEVTHLAAPEQTKQFGAPAIDREAGPGQTQESKALELKGLGVGGNVIHKGAMFDRHGERRAR